MSMSIVFLYAHNHKASCAVYANEIKKNFQITTKNCGKNLMDLGNSLVTSSKLSGQSHRKGPTTENRTLMSRYKQQTTAGGL